MAIDWQSRTEIARDARILAAFTLVLFGIAVREFVLHLPFDISIVFGKRKWRWPMMLYFLCRITMLAHTISMSVNLNAISEVNCIGLVISSKVSDALGTCASSLLLSLRTFAIWGHDLRVGIPLFAMWLGQIVLWGMTFRFSHSQWDPVRKVCAVGSTAPKSYLVPVFSYTMGYDFVILALCVWSLWPDRKRAGISAIVLRDGIGYFTAVFLANTLQSVVAALQLNPPMNLMFLPFALVVSTIAASTVFRNLLFHDAPSSASAGFDLSDTGASLPRFAKHKTQVGALSTAEPVYTSSGYGSSSGAEAEAVHFGMSILGRTEHDMEVLASQPTAGRRESDMSMEKAR